MSWQAALRALPHPLTIVGVGNRLRGDDAAGPLVLDRLKGKTAAVLIDAGVAPENYLSPIAATAPRCVLIIDAVCSGRPAGTVDFIRKDGLSGVAVSTHAIPLSLFISLLRERSDAEVVVLGIQPKTTSGDAGLSCEVRDAVAGVASCLCAADTAAPDAPPPAR